MSPDWRIVEHEQSGLVVERCQFIGEGWNSHVYLVNDELVFRFPKRQACWTELQREIAFLDCVADHLPVAVPRYLVAAPDSRATAHGYAMYRYLPGDALDIRVLSDLEREAAADALASFLKALHTFTPPEDVAALLPSEDARAVAEEYREIAGRVVLPHLGAPQASALRRELDRQVDAPDSPGPPVVLHADLSREHILSDGRAITGVLDFGDVNVGDPDYDFVYIYLDFGCVFTEATARRYGHPDVERLRARLRYYALVDQIDTIAHGAGLALPGQEQHAWQRLRQMLEARGTD